MVILNDNGRGANGKSNTFEEAWGEAERWRRAHGDPTLEIKVRPVDPKKGPNSPHKWSVKYPKLPK